MILTQPFWLKEMKPRYVFPPTQARWIGKSTKLTRETKPTQATRIYTLKIAASTSKNYRIAERLGRVKTEPNWIWQQLRPYQRRIIFKRLSWARSLYRFLAFLQNKLGYEQINANHQIQLAVGRAKMVNYAEYKITV